MHPATRRAGQQPYHPLSTSAPLRQCAPDDAQQPVERALKGRHLLQVWRAARQLREQQQRLVAQHLRRGWQEK